MDDLGEQQCAWFFIVVQVVRLMKGSVVVLAKIEAFFWMLKPLFYLRF